MAKASRHGCDDDDHRLAAELATGAGVLLADLRKRLFDAGTPAATLRAEGDRLAQEMLAEALARARPLDAVLSEEAPDDPSRLRAERVWVIDPLDGTREFAETGRSDWAVHVALVMDARPVAGAVALPAQGVTFSTACAPVLPRRGERPPRLVVSRSRPPAEARSVASALGAEIVALGSAGAKAMAVVSGTADLYLHSGGQYEWDSCAPAAVAAAARCRVSRLDGAELRYNQPDPYLADLLICRPEFHDSALHALSRRSSEHVTREGR